MISNPIKIQNEDELVRYFEPRIKKYAASLGRKIGVAADDMEQELYIVLLRAFRTYGEYDSRFDGYFVHSVRNFFINFLNGKKRKSKHRTISLDQLGTDFNYEKEDCDIELEAQLLTGMTLGELTQLPKRDLKQLVTELRGLKEPVNRDLIIKVVNEFLDGKTYTQLHKEYACKGLTNPRMVHHWIERLIEQEVISKKQVEERMASSKNARAKYSPEQKRAIVMEYLQGSTSAKEVAQKYGINPSQIFIWKKQLGIEQKKVQSATPEEEE